eukprot:1908459-Rhodomonas_salina.1
MHASFLLCLLCPVPFAAQVFVREGCPDGEQCAQAQMHEESLLSGANPRPSPCEIQHKSQTNWHGLRHRTQNAILSEQFAPRSYLLSQSKASSRHLSTIGARIAFDFATCRPTSAPVLISGMPLPGAASHIGMELSPYNDVL